jgi:regulatory protein
VQLSPAGEGRGWINKYNMQNKKSISTAKALGKLQKICSLQEKCSADVVLLLKRWGIEPQDHQEIIDRLKADKFVDESRFASAFVRDKIHFDHWGIIKINFFLKQKGIAKKVIQEVLNSIDRGEYEGMIRRELEKKKKTLKGTPRERWAKLARYGSARGYEMDYMQEILGEITPDE